MPLDELLALYGYEASDPISERESEGSDTTANLPDMTLDKVSGLGPGFREDRCDSPPPPTVRADCQSGHGLGLEEGRSGDWEERCSSVLLGQALRVLTRSQGGCQQGRLYHRR